MPIQRERAEQIAVFRWAKLMTPKHPELALLHAIPNGGKRHRIEAYNLKLSGVKAGIPDICFPIARYGYCGLWIEMKVGKNSLTQCQRDMIALLAEYGNSCHVCFNAGEAINVISWYIGLIKETP